MISYVTVFAGDDAIAALGGTTSLLLLAVFAMVNVAVLILRRDSEESQRHYRTPTALPVIGCAASLYLVTPLSDRPGQQYVLAAILIGSGVVLSMATQVFNRHRTRRALRIDEIAAVGV